METSIREVRSDDGYLISIRECSPTNPDGAVVFVHGATYGGGAMFDPDGMVDYSWLRWVADSGSAAFAVDIRGYGESERPDEMLTEDAAEIPVRASVAALDVKKALETIDAEIAGPIHLVGTSWGSMIVGVLLTTQTHPAIESVTLHAPVFEPGPSVIGGLDIDRLSAVRTVDKAQARSRWDEQIPSDTPATFRGGSTESDPVFDAFWESLITSGQRIDGETSIMAPNGVLVDIYDGGNGNHIYDPGAIERPTLVVRGSLDKTSTRTDAVGLYDALEIPDDDASYVEIAGGTHFIHLETRRTELYNVVNDFQTRQRSEST